MSDQEIVGFVFAYGSLADPDDYLVQRSAEAFSKPIHGELSGYRRRWNVAKENWSEQNDHKYYVDPESGERPRIRVASVNLVEAEGPSANGVAIPVDATRLSLFDQREGGMSRIEVTGRFSAPLPHRLWTYVANSDGRRIFDEGMAENNVYVRAAYKRRVEDSFRRLGSEPLRQYEASTDPPACPVRELDIVRAEGDRGI